MFSLLKKLPLGMKIATAGGAIGILAGGIASIISAPIPGTIFFLIFVGVFGSIFWKILFKPMVETHRLLERGEDAEATILALQENGSSLTVAGGVPKPGIRLTLEVHSKSRPAYQAQTNAFISTFEIGMYQPGQTVKIKIDPENPQRIILANAAATLGMGAGSSVTAAPSPEVQIRMNALLAKQEELFILGEEAPATILEAKETTYLINGDNPLVELKVRVTPHGGESFEAQTECPVVRSSLVKFRLGKTIVVKFDPRNPSRVAVFRSEASS